MWRGDTSVRQAHLNRALTTAADTGDAVAVKHLLDQGARLRAIIDTGESPRTPLDWLRAMFRGAGSNDDRVTVSALYMAVNRGNLEVIRLLESQGADLMQYDDGYSMLHIAVMGFARDNALPTETNDPVKAELIRYLIDKGIDVNATDKYGFTALMIAAKDPDVGVVKLLLDRGADVNSKDKYGWTALIAASSYGRIQIMKLLLAKGADVNAKTTDGDTPMKCATAQGHIAVVALLRQAGAKQ